MEDDIKTLAKNIVAAVNDGDSTGLHDVIVAYNRDRKDLDIHVWSLLTEVNESLQNIEFTSQQHSTYALFLQITRNYGNPKELAYAYLEACDAFRNSEVFLLIVPFLAEVLLKLPEKQRSLEIVCSTLYSHIKSYQWSHGDYQLVQEEENGLRNASDLSIVTTESTEQLLRLVECLVEQLVIPVAGVCNDNISNNNLTELLIRILQYPLLYIHYNDKHSSIFQMVVSTLVQLHPTITSVFLSSFSPYSPVFNIDNMIANPLDTARVTEEDLLPGYGCLMYILMYERYECEAFPQVYSTPFLFTSNLHILHSLFIRSSNSAVGVKASRLLKVLLGDINRAELCTDLLDLHIVKESLTYVCWSMQFSDLLVTRQCSAQTLPLLGSRFDIKGRYQIFLSILNKESSPEILSYIYTLIKDFIHDIWNNSDTNASKYSLALMEKIFRVPEGESGQLVADLNKISSALNLARYLVRKDSRRTAVYTREMNNYIEAYIRPIGKCLKTELVTQEERLEKLKRGEYEAPEMSVDVGGDTLEYTVEMEREATMSSINKINLVLHVYDCLRDTLSI